MEKLSAKQAKKISQEFGTNEKTKELMKQAMSKIRQEAESGRNNIKFDDLFCYLTSDEQDSFVRKELINLGYKLRERIKDHDIGKELFIFWG